MAAFIRYTCRYDLFPMLEGTLAAHGYRVELPFQKSLGGAESMVMSGGATSILFTHAPQSGIVEIEVWGEAQTAAVRLLESLPLGLIKLPAVQHR
jgi:hypothetical protein